ncbi:MAG: hypothetical protein ABF379_03565, partial [Akkermansiaceae bacterium]
TALRRDGRFFCVITINNNCSQKAGFIQNYQEEAYWSPIPESVVTDQAMRRTTPESKNGIDAGQVSKS